MRPSNVHIGREGEEEAAHFLQQLGYEIIRRNFTVRGGEIDIIARDHNAVVFVEVKSFRSFEFGAPESWVDERKQKRIGLAAERFLMDYHIEDCDCRFDVLTVDLSHRPPQIKHLQDAFWLDDDEYSQVDR